MRLSLSLFLYFDRLVTTKCLLCINCFLMRQRLSVEYFIDIARCELVACHSAECFYNHNAKHTSHHLLNNRCFRTLFCSSNALLIFFYLALVDSYQFVKTLVSLLSHLQINTIVVLILIKACFLFILMVNDAMLCHTCITSYIIWSCVFNFTLEWDFDHEIIVHFKITMQVKIFNKFN